MALFSINKLLGALKSFLNTMPSPLGGYNMSDVKVNNKDGKYSALFTFNAEKPEARLSDERTLDDKENTKGLTNIKGEKIKLNVLISAINVNDALEPLLSGMNNMSVSDSEVADHELASTELLNVLLGSGRDDNQIQSGKGLLGVDLKDDNKFFVDFGTYDGKPWSWNKIASEYLKYSLECQAEGKDYGAIENQELDTCQNLISEYLMRVDLIDNEDEVKVDVMKLCLPILGTVQAKLCEYYQDAYNKMVEGKSTAERESEAQANTEGENTQEENNPSDEGTTDNSNTEGGGQPVGQSKHISVKLQKITASDDIQLLALKSNYAIPETLEDIDDIINQDEFQQSLTDSPLSFNIDVDDDGYSIEPCENCEAYPCDSLKAMMNNAIIMYRNLYILHWMAKGNDMMKLHLFTEELYKELIDEIDVIGELLVEKCGTVENLDFEWQPLEIKNYDFQEGLAIISDFIDSYLATIDYAYPNQTSDVQSTLDEWIRYWKKQLNYFVKGQEI